MKILQVHNFYQQPGGEDLVVADEARLLEARGHEVLRYTAHNDQVNSLSKLTVLGRTIWSQPAYHDVRALIAQHRPHVVHVHNTLPLISPSVYYAAAAEQVPVIQTLHNYRLMCPAALCLRDGKVCTDCVGKTVAWPAIRHACYRESRAATSAVVAMLSAHRLLRTWDTKTSIYIALTAWARKLFIESGLPADKLVVKPNFVEPDPGAGAGAGRYAVYVGRLSAEKGIRTLLDAWRTVGTQLPLLVIGDGPLATDVESAAREIPGVTWLGKRTSREIQPLLREATCLVFPSECYETFGRVIAEAFAAATPVVAAGHGAAAELVSDGHTGLHFRPGDPQDLVSKVTRISSDPRLRARLSVAARTEFEARFSAAINYEALMAIYHRAIQSRPAPSSPKIIDRDRAKEY